MLPLSNAPAGIILCITVGFLVVLSLQIDPSTKTSRWVQNALWFGAINIGAVAGMYLFWAWAPYEWAVEYRQWAKLVDGLAAFGVAGAMYGLHRTIKR